MTSSAIAERRGVGLLALVSIGILIASMVLALRPAPVLAGDPECLQPLDVVIIVDRSGSMLTQEGANDRLEWAQLAATGFVTDLNNNGGVGGAGLHRVGVASYGGEAGTGGAATTQALLTADLTAAQVNAAINGITSNVNHNTPLLDGILEGQALMGVPHPDVAGVPVHTAYILLSDGRPWPDGASTRPDAGEIATFVGSANEAFGIAIGEGGTGAFNPDLTLMQALSAPAGNFHHITDAGDLPDLFAALAEDLTCGDIDIEKTPEPAGPVDAGTEVTYTYEVSNNGEAPLINVVVTDDTCAPVNYVSGDDGNSQLESDEVWVYECSMVLEETTTNEACADGDFIGGGSDSDCATVTVEVNPPPPPDEPGIDIEKTPLDSEGDEIEDPLPPGGGAVTYEFVVTNTGNTDLENVEVADWLLVDGELPVDPDPGCSPIEGPEGDDGDGLLNPDESWTYECTTEIEETTENRACVGASVAEDAPQLVTEPVIVTACDDAEVEVGEPEGSEAGQTGTPAGSVPDTATTLPGAGGPLATLIFGALLVASLGTLAYANVRAARQRR